MMTGYAECDEVDDEYWEPCYALVPIDNLIAAEGNL